MYTYKAALADATRSSPLGQAIVKGLYVMPPPQEKPTQPISTGAVTWRITGKGAAATSGIATPKVIPASLVLEEKQRPRSSQ